MKQKKVAVVGRGKVKNEVKKAKEKVVSQEEKQKKKTGLRNKLAQEGKVKKTSLASKNRQRKKGIPSGSKYLKARKLIDQSKVYLPKEAVSLLVKTAWANFNEAAEAHLVIKQKGFSAQVNFPYDQGKKKVIAVADDEKTMAKIKSGNIDFDVLLATPKAMTKLVPYARILGPRGLMPNPKEGTITDNPTKRAKELEEAGIKVKTEKNFPLMHVVFGRLNQKEAELEENLKFLVRTISSQNIEKLVITSTMGPGINVKV